MFNFATFFLMMAVLSETPAAESSIPLWFWFVMVVILVVLPILVLIRGPALRKEQLEQAEMSQEAGGGGAVEDHDDHHHEEHHEVEHRAAPAAVAEAPPEPAVEPAPVKPDDLKKIEGIGPKISQVLQNAGIQTFAQLADTSVTALQNILGEESRLRLADPTTWPAQAKLAAAGDWEALQQLQDDLTGGRK